MHITAINDPGGHYSNQVHNGDAWNYKKYFAKRGPCYNHLN